MKILEWREGDNIADREVGLGAAAELRLAVAEWRARWKWRMLKASAKQKIAEWLGHSVLGTNRNKQQPTAIHSYICGYYPCCGPINHVAMSLSLFLFNAVQLYYNLFNTHPWYVYYIHLAPTTTLQVTAFSCIKMQRGNRMWSGSDHIDRGWQNPASEQRKPHSLRLLQGTCSVYGGPVTFWGISP